jgi:hypothetical protein
MDTVDKMDSTEKTIDERVCELAEWGCSDPEIAMVLHTTVTELTLRFAGALQKGRAKRCEAVRKTAYEAATNGNMTSLAWFWKQDLSTGFDGTLSTIPSLPGQAPGNGADPLVRVPRGLNFNDEGAHRRCDQRRRGNSVPVRSSTPSRENRFRHRLRRGHRGTTTTTNTCHSEARRFRATLFRATGVPATRRFCAWWGGKSRTTESCRKSEP